MESRTYEEIRAALIKQSWRMRAGAGPVVVYPDEVLVELYPSYSKLPADDYIEFSMPKKVEVEKQ